MKLSDLPLLRTDINLAAFCQPGIYKIVCLKNQKVYIGQTNNCLNRIGKHFTDLNNKSHHCLSLQKDFEIYGSSQFQAFIIASGKKFEKQSYRKTYETNLLKNKIKTNVYNFELEKSLKNPFYGCYGYQDQVFNTIKELRFYIMKNENKFYSESQFRRLYISPFGKYHYKIKLIKKRPQSDIFNINGFDYFGWKQVVEAGLAKNQRQVYFRVQSSKWPNYIWKLKTKKRAGLKKTTYLINNKQYIGAAKVVEAKLAEDVHQVYYRVRSKSKT